MRHHRLHGPRAPAGRAYDDSVDWWALGVCSTDYSEAALLPGPTLEDMFCAILREEPPSLVSNAASNATTRSRLAEEVVGARFNGRRAVSCLLS